MAITASNYITLITYRLVSRETVYFFPGIPDTKDWYSSWRVNTTSWWGIKRQNQTKISFGSIFGLFF